MKKIFYCVVLLALVINFGACKKETESGTVDKNSSSNGFIPTSVTVDIPSSICSSTATSKKTAAASESFNGNSLYGMLRVFIYVGKASAFHLQNIVKAIDYYKLENVNTAEFISEEDNRTKVITITKNVALNGETWAFNLILKDKASDKTGMQICWNRNPVKVVAIINPYVNNNKDADGILQQNAMYRIEYSEASNIGGYDRYMIVSIAGLEKDKAENFYANSLKMFVGAKGSVIDIMGNSNHPNFQIIDKNWTEGRNWAFVARSDSAKNIAVAKVALAPCSYNTTDNIFAAYALDSVLRTECRTYWAPFVQNYPQYADTINRLINVYTQNAEAPAFFNKGGFVAAGTVPVVTAQNPEFAGFTNEFVDISTLNPYVPKEINDLVIQFMQ